MRKATLLLFFFVLGTTQLHGQQLIIGQMPYRLGMTMKEATDITHDPIYLDEIHNTSSAATWVIREKHGENNYVIIGSIMFRNGRVETLERELKSFLAKDAKDVGNILFQALERLRRDDPTVSINTHRVFVSSESGDVRTITIGTGLRRIEIMLPEAGDSTMTISEILTLAKPLHDK
jgi:hypothetical protein